MIDGTYNAKESRFDVVKKFLARRLSMTTKDTRVWSVIGLAIVAFLLLWAGSLVFAYWADDINPTPADERSMPTPRLY
ncbi:MAG TPA: hypothetical protein VKC61_22635 [Pyrinomonadaceae bacterium]|nr:hypothetical protein [Pyrinomonadaceae bacterium]